MEKTNAYSITTIKKITVPYLYTLHSIFYFYPVWNPALFTRIYLLENSTYTFSISTKYFSTNILIIYTNFCLNRKYVLVTASSSRQITVQPVHDKLDYCIIINAISCIRLLPYLLKADYKNHGWGFDFHSSKILFYCNTIALSL